MIYYICTLFSRLNSLKKNTEKKLFLFDCFAILGLFCFFSFLLFRWYTIYNTIPLGLVAEYFYRAWDLYEAYQNNGFLLYLNHLFFSFETLQPGLHPVISSVFLIFLKGDWWWMVYLQSLLYLLLVITFTYRLCKQAGGRLLAVFFTFFLISPFSVFRNFMTYNIEVAFLSFGVVASYYLFQSVNQKNLYKVLISLFLMTLVRPIDGLFLSLALIVLYLWLLARQGGCSTTELWVYFFSSILVVCVFAISPFPVSMIFPLFLLVLIFLGRKTLEKKFSFHFELNFAPLSFVVLYCFIFAPVTVKLLNWAQGGASSHYVSWWQSFSQSVLIVYNFKSELASLGFLVLCTLLICWRIRRKLNGELSVFFLLLPCLLSVGGAYLIKNATFQYHVLSFFLVGVFLVLVVSVSYPKWSRIFLALGASYCIFLNLDCFFSFEPLSVDFWKIFNQRGLIQEAGCFSSNYQDSSISLIQDIKHANNKNLQPLSLFVEPSATDDNLHLDKFRLKTIAHMQGLDLNVSLQDLPNTYRAGDFFLSKNSKPSDGFKFVASLRTYSSGCQKNKILFLYQAVNPKVF